MAGKIGKRFNTIAFRVFSSIIGFRIEDICVLQQNLKGKSKERRVEAKWKETYIYRFKLCSEDERADGLNDKVIYIGRFVPN